MGFFSRMAHMLCAWILGRERVDILCEGLLKLLESTLVTERFSERLGIDFRKKEIKKELDKMRRLVFGFWRFTSAAYKDSITPEDLKEVGFVLSSCRFGIRVIKEESPKNQPKLHIVK